MAKRRPNGQGTITQRTDGRYQGAAYVTDTDGCRVRRYRYGDTYDEVAEKLAKLQEQERNGVPVPSKAWKVGEWLTYWLDEIVKPSTEHNTYAKYEGKVRLYLIPHLGKKSMVRLTPTQVRTALATMKREEVPPPTRAETLRVLRNALNRARREELLTRNVAELVDMPRVDKQERKPWSAKEAITFLSAVRQHRLYAALVLLLTLGLRRGELLGLRWQDIDFENEQFTPVRQVQREKGELILKKLKTDSSQAALPLPAFCADALRERKRVQNEERAKAGPRWHQEPGEDLVFTERHGGPIEPRGFSRTFETLVSNAKPIRRITVRLARHTCGTLLAFLKVHPKAAQAILRHSQISMTMDIYTHVVDDDQRAAAALLAKLLEGGIHTG
ncbi:tyrosine-type recombinase/integrase [Streptomyces radicis]|uniref:Site-specific integrase n=1 Tax=Streptomyces radicis TaxID=1750517 RepID=A0A3A9W4F0_9ACTN|nr:site-specific integrase [Streptomyces radicis]RKN07293.1 site-specific integrase [Streptomyces radicis]RKN26691.1 site-specific integrase [Streptomyces radicis]